MRVSSRTAVLPDFCAVDRYGAGGSRRRVTCGRLGSAAADCFGVGNFDWLVCMDRAATSDAKHRTGLYRGAFRVGEFRICSRAFAGDKFSVEFVGLSGGGKSWTHSVDEHHRDLWVVIFGGGI